MTSRWDDQEYLSIFKISSTFGLSEDGNHRSFYILINW